MQIAGAFGLASAAWAQSGVANIEVRSTEDGYIADMVVWVAAPRELAFEVLVDFEHMASWVPNVRDSRVLERETNRATIEYQGVVRFGFLTVPFTTVREIEFAAPAWIRSKQIKGTMKRHESRIDFVAEGTETRLDYHVEMVPSALAAIVLNKRRIEHELREHFDAITTEILRRKKANPMRRATSPAARSASPSFAGSNAYSALRVADTVLRKATTLAGDAIIAAD